MCCRPVRERTSARCAVVQDLRRRLDRFRFAGSIQAGLSLRLTATVMAAENPEPAGRLELPTGGLRNRCSKVDLDSTPQHASGSRARLLRVPPGDPRVQTLDGHVVELGAVALK